MAKFIEVKAMQELSIETNKALLNIEEIFMAIKCGSGTSVWNGGIEMPFYVEMPFEEFRKLLDNN